MVALTFTEYSYEISGTCNKFHVVYKVYERPMVESLVGFKGDTQQRYRTIAVRVPQ